MSWYNIFYWVTVADGVKLFFNVFAVIFSIASGVSTVGYFIAVFNKASEVAGNSKGEEDLDAKSWNVWVLGWKKVWRLSVIVMLISWAGFVFCPSKKDAVLIIAGGAVGNFITSDSSARQIPSELTLLVREKMRSEIKELKAEQFSISDTLATKSKEELIEILRKKQ